VRVSILCLDPGEKRIGVAVAEPPVYVAVPLEMVPAEPAETALARIAAIATERSAKLLVVGLPLQTDGQEGAAARAARRFAQNVGDLLQLPVEFQDERMSSNEAQRALSTGGNRSHRSSGRTDAVAASLILSAYLERTREART
jgi:putative Holliday junction resolvase